MPHTFPSDVDEIARDLISAFNLNYNEHEPKLSDPLIRWLDYRLRYIDPCPREILKSKNFDSRVPADAVSALNAFLALVKSGADLNPYQTKTIKRHDSSGVKRQLRTDGLWADWAIHHIHLTEVPLGPGDEFSVRSDWLLFFVVSKDYLALIDVRSHDEADLFQSIDLVELAIRSWPESFERFALKGIVGLARTPSVDPGEIKQLRTAGVTQFVEVDGKAYMPPGFGVTTAATAGRVSMMAVRVNRLANDIGNFYSDVGGQAFMQATKTGVKNPSFSLAITPQGRLIVWCAESKITWPFPSPAVPGDARSELEALLLPPWAGARLAAYLAAEEATKSSGNESSEAN